MISKKLYPSTIITLPEKILDHNGKERAMGYWKFKDQTCGGESNPTMATCLAALQLMVYYRYLPTTQTKAGEVESDTGASKSKKDEVEVEVDI